MKSRFIRGTILGAVVAVAVLATGMAQAAGVPGQGTWETTLQPRDIDGDTVTDAFYDTVLDITWLRNADVNGQMNWDEAVTWVNTLVVGGVGGWRLPTVRPVNGTSFEYRMSNNGTTDIGTAKTGVGWGLASELGHLYYVTLGNKGQCTPNDALPDSCDFQYPYGLTNTGGFQNMRTYDYTTGTRDALDPRIIFSFSPNIGYQSTAYVIDDLSAMAVRPGDVAAVPEPQSYAMLLLGLGVVLLAVRQRLY